MPTLKEQRKRAMEISYRRKADDDKKSQEAKPTAPPPASAPVPDPKIAELETYIVQQNEQITSLREQIAGLMNKKVEVDVTAGDVEVKMPEQPTRLDIEFEDGRTATVTPVYE